MQRVTVFVVLSLFFFTSCVSTKSKPVSALADATALSRKALEFQEAGKYDEAIPCAEKSLQIREKALGKDHPDVAESLSELAGLYHDTGRYAEAEPLHKRSLEIMERARSKSHPDVAKNLNGLALLYHRTSRYAEAEPLYKKSLEIREKALGRNHPDVAMSLNNLAGLYHDTGRYAEAELLFMRSLEINEKALGRDHPNVAGNLNNLAALYKTTGRYAEAEPLCKKSLEIREKALGRNHPDVAMSLNNLAGLYQDTGRYAEAEPLYKKSLEINEKALGRDHPNVASSLSNLAALYQDTGRYAEAEPLYKRSLEIYVKVQGWNHPCVANSLSNLASLYETTGRDAEALLLYINTFGMYEKVLGKDHPRFASSLSSVARFFKTARRYAEAELLFMRSLEIDEKAIGRDHPNVASSLSNLAALYQDTGRDAEAEPLYKRSLEIYQKALGRDHPDVATGLNGLALLYHRSGRYAEAEPLYERSLEIKEKALGKDHPSIAAVLSNLSLVYWATNKNLNAHKMLARAVAIDAKKRENVFSLLSETHKLRYIGKTNANICGFMSHTVRHMPLDMNAVIDTFDAWLRWKGAVMEAQGRYIDALTHSEDPEIKKKFDDLANIRREIARLQLSDPGKINFEECKKRLRELEIKKGSQEAELTRLSNDFSLEKLVGKADTKRISETLLKKGTESVYIDFANIRVLDFKEKRFSKLRYLVFVLIPEKVPVVKLVELSDAEEADSHIRAYLEEMKRAKEYGDVPRERILKAEAKALYELLLKPLEPDIQDKKHLYISPDGNLNLIPFEVLMTPEGKYLMEDYNITYIAAGRDIIRFADTNVAKGEPLIIADPDYDMGLEEKTQVAKAMGMVETRSPASLSRDAKDMRFRRLPDTKQEADAIEKCLKETQKINVKNYQDKKALEEVLLTANSPRLLHLATHGYFLKDEEVKHQPQMMGLMSLEKERFIDPGIENPMLRSGIVLAGANASLKEGRDDGVISAEKILGLRLKGTDLVVLSACETGVGDVKSGEGVFGLKRSFILSGAKTVVMSLWSIPSKETTELMTDFYTLMAKGKTKAEALREARLNLMKKKPNPFYWGAFIMVGNPN